MTETRKIAAILVADVVGYSRLAGADEEGTPAHLRASRGDLIDPTIASAWIEGARNPALSAYPSKPKGPARAAGDRSRPDPTQDTTPRLSIVVLPFANIGRDPEPEHCRRWVEADPSLCARLRRRRGREIYACPGPPKSRPLPQRPVTRNIWPRTERMLEGLRDAGSPER
jgi:class 3 adenylate cyclase